MASPEISVDLRAVIFDYSHVLTFPTKEGHVRAMADLCRVDYDRFLSVYDTHLPAYDRGIHDGTAFWTHILSGIGILGKRGLIDSLIEKDTENQLNVNPVVLSWADQLTREGLETAILSNMSKDDVSRMTKEHIFDLLGSFKACILSSEVGIAKPDRAIYELCLSRLRVAPREALFIDDNEDNIRAAHDLGIPCYLFTDFESDLPRIARQYRLPAPPAM